MRDNSQCLIVLVWSTPNMTLSAIYIYRAFTLDRCFLGHDILMEKKDSLTMCSVNFWENLVQLLCIHEFLTSCKLFLVTYVTICQRAVSHVQNLTATLPRRKQKSNNIFTVSVRGRKNFSCVRLKNFLAIMVLYCGLQP